MSWLGWTRRTVASVTRRKQGVLTLKFPIEHGVVANWDDSIILHLRCCNFDVSLFDSFVYIR